MDPESVSVFSQGWVAIASSAFQVPSLLATIVAVASLLISASWLSFLRRRRSLPPGPYPWPVLGNLPDLGFLPYRSLAKLADRFGPALTVWLGSMPSVIISSPDLAREVLKTKDSCCSSRPRLNLLSFVTHGGKDLVFSPSDDHWRMQRRLATLHLLSSRKIQESIAVRERQVRDMLDAIAKEANNGDARGVEVREYLKRATLNTILMLTVGKHYTYDTIHRAAAAAPGEMLEAAFKTDWQGRIAAIRGGKSAAELAIDEMEGEKVIAMIDETFQVLGTFNLGDFIPWLSPLDPQRVFARTKRSKPHFEGFVLACIEERSRLLKTRRREKEEDRGRRPWEGEESGEGEGFSEEEWGERVLVDALLEMEEEEEDLVTRESKVTTEKGRVTTREGKVTREDILLLCLDLLSAGTDTSSKTVEWALAELASHPAMLERLQAEVDAACATSVAEAAPASAGTGEAAAAAAAATATATAAATAVAAGGGGGKQRAGVPGYLPVNDMPYLQAVIRETLRHHPPVPLLIPHMTTAAVTIGGYTIPPNTIIQINAWGLAHDPTVWINPHEFDPSRFLGPSAPDVTGQNFDVLPFGSGRRQCAGMNLGLDLSARMLAGIIRRFNVTVPDDVIGSGGVDLGEGFSLTMELAKSLRLKLTERDQSLS